MTMFYDMNLLIDRDNGTAEVMFDILMHNLQNIVCHGKTSVALALIIQMRILEIAILLKQEF